MIERGEREGLLYEILVYEEGVARKQYLLIKTNKTQSTLPTKKCAASGCLMCVKGGPMIGRPLSRTRDSTPGGVNSACPQSESKYITS